MQVKQDRTGNANKDRTPDKESLSTYDFLMGYCESQFGAPKKKGKEYVFPCPFGNHKDSYRLAVSVVNGRGVWKCRACDIGGDIFGLYAQLNGIPSTKGENFVKILHGLAGISFNEVKHQIRFYKQSKTETKQEGLTKAQLETLEACQVRLSNDFPLCRKLGAELGISGEVIYSCATFTDLFPTLGVTDDDRLLFIYRDYDTTQNKYVPFMAKIRRFSDGSPSPFLKLNEDGTWQSYGNMVSVSHTRFIQVAKGCIKAPWGAQALNAGKQCFVLCEGESDALAVNDAMLTYQEAWQQEEGFRFDCVPVALGVPGASNLKAVCPELFKGKAVVLCFDQDKAGKEAVAKLESELRSNGAKVIVWRPSGKEKDCREILIRQGRMSLSSEIYQALKKVK